MLQQLPTTNVATVQQALDLSPVGRGPHLVGNFRGKGCQCRCIGEPIEN